MKKRLIAILFSIALFSMVSGAVLAAYSSTITLVNTSSTGYDMLSANITTNVDYMADSIFTDSEGLDTRVMLGTAAQNHMLADDRILFSTPLPANSSKTLYFTTGNSDLSGFAIIPGYDGYVTTDDDADIELSDNFTEKQQGWVDTTYSDNKTLVWKPGAYITYISGTGNITSGIAGAPEIVAFETGDDDAAELHGVIWETQTFTTPNRTTNYPLGAVELLIYREGSPETVTASIRATTATGNVTGADIGSGTINGSTITANTSGAWTTINLGCFLEPDTQYGVVLRATGGDASNSIWWRLDTGNGYADGSRWFSSDSGVTWGLQLVSDYMFKIQGYEGVTATGLSSGEYTVKTNDQPVLYFDGVDDYVHCGADSSLNAGSAFTLIQWINFADDNTTGMTLAKTDTWGAITASYRLYRTGADNFMNWNVFRSGGLIDVTATSTTTFTKDEWRMVAGTFNGTYDADIYVNGVLEDTDNLGGAIQNTTANFTIGCQLTNGAWSTGVNATIGEVWAYSAALSEAEILQHYNGTFTDTTDLVGYWHLDEGGGSKALDYSAETNDGVIVSATWGNEILRLYIDDELEDVEYGGTVPDTSDNWSFMQNNSMPYSDNITIAVDGSQVLWYEPNAIIDSQVLPDRQGGDENGYIYWGTLPTDTSVSLGVLVSDYEGSTITAEGTQDIAPVITPPAVESDATKTAGITDPLLPVAEAIEEATSGRLPVLLQYWWAYTLLSLIGFIVVYARFLNLILAGIISIIPFGWGVAQGIFDFWIIPALVMWLIGCTILEGRRTI